MPVRIVIIVILAASRNVVLACTDDADSAKQTAWLF
jgi:hypothetical protein